MKQSAAFSQGKFTEKRRCYCVKKLFCAVFACVCFLCTGMAIPTETNQQDIADEKRIITRVYDLPPSEDPETLKEEPFELDGYAYEYQSMTKEEHSRESVKAVSQKVTLETESGEWEEIVPQLASTVPYTDEDGYEGDLTLDTSSIQTEVREYKPTSDTVSDTRTYTDLAYNDPTLIPQTVTKNGMTLHLQDVTWTAQGGSGEAGTLFPSSYTATASYSASASSRKADGYVTTAVYYGEVSKIEDTDITYTVTYLGTPVEPESEGPSPAIPIITAAAIIFTLGAGGALVFLYIKKKKKETV